MIFQTRGYFLDTRNFQFVFVFFLSFLHSLAKTAIRLWIVRQLKVCWSKISCTITEALGIEIVSLITETLCNLLLYGSFNMNMIDNRIIIETKTE